MKDYSIENILKDIKFSKFFTKNYILKMKTKEEQEKMLLEF